MRNRAYGKNKILFEKYYDTVVSLRSNGYGYGTISKKLNIPVHLVVNWSKYIKVDFSKSVSLGMCYNTENYKFHNYLGIKAKRDFLIRKRGHKCEKCRRAKWLGRLIVLELHNHTKPEEEALLLCPNCHSQTDDWRGRGKIKLPK